MTILENFQAAAERLFSTFEELLVSATYVQESSSYVAGGNNVITQVEYPIRLVLDDSRSTLTLQAVATIAPDVAFKSVRYLMITSELPVAAQAKDSIKVGSETKIILAVEVDPGGVITTLYVG